MLSMILQLGGVGDLINGIATAVAGDFVDDENRNGKFDFWYQ